MRTQDGTFSPCTNHLKKGKMPPFPGLTREEEAEEEEHSIMQLRSLLCHKQEHRFFSSQFKALIKPKFRPKPEADPAWKPGMEPLYSRPRKPRKKPSPPRPSAACLPPQDAEPEEEEEPSTNMADFASYFENLQ